MPWVQGCTLRTLLPVCPPAVCSSLQASLPPSPSPEPHLLRHSLGQLVRAPPPAAAAAPASLHQITPGSAATAAGMLPRASTPTPSPVQGTAAQLSQAAGAARAPSPALPPAPARSPSPALQGEPAPGGHAGAVTASLPSLPGSGSVLSALLGAGLTTSELAGLIDRARQQQVGSAVAAASASHGMVAAQPAANAAAAAPSGSIAMPGYDQLHQQQEHKHQQLHEQQHHHQHHQQQYQQHQQQHQQQYQHQQHQQQYQQQEYHQQQQYHQPSFPAGNNVGLLSHGPLPGLVTMSVSLNPHQVPSPQPPHGLVPSFFHSASLSSSEAFGHPSGGAGRYAQPGMYGGGGASPQPQLLPNSFFQRPDAAANRGLPAGAPSLGGWGPIGGGQLPGQQLPGGSSIWQGDGGGVGVQAGFSTGWMRSEEGSMQPPQPPVSFNGSGARGHQNGGHPAG